MTSGTTDPQLAASPGPGRGAYSIPLSLATTTGFIGRTERGPINEPVCVKSFAEYCRLFGGHLADGALSHSVHDYFLHGGLRAVVVRVTNRARRGTLDIPTDSEPLRLQARHPGKHELLRVSIDHEEVENDPTRFNLIVQRLSSSGSRLVEDQEFYPMISVDDDDDRYIGTALRDSRLVALAGPAPATRPQAMPPERPGDPVRYVSLTVPGEDGEELTDYDIIGSNRDGTGLFAFNRGPRIDLLVIPLLPDRVLGTTALVAAARFCEAQRAILIWDPPCTWQSVDAAMLGARQLGFTSSHAMTYFPRVRPRGAKIRYANGLPAAGAIAGMLAQRDRRGVFGRDQDSDYALRATLTPVLDLRMLEAQRLARHGINTFVRATGGITRLIGRVTLGSGNAGQSTGAGLEVRRLESFILNSIEDAVAGAQANPDRNAVLERLQLRVRRFLFDLYQHGALKGDTPEQAFFLQAGKVGDGPGVRFGIALRYPARFDEFMVALYGADAGKAERVDDIVTTHSIA
jgi:hypothetical protein